MKRTLIALLIITCLVSGCSKNTRDTAAPATSRAGASGSSNDKSGGGNIAQTNYYGEMDEDKFSEEMVRLLSALQSGKITMDEYMERVDELSNKAEEFYKNVLEGIAAENRAAASAPSTAPNTGSGNTQSSGRRFVAEQYRGDFASNVDENGWTGIRIGESTVLIGGELFIIPLSLFETTDPPYAWTVGNELWIQPAYTGEGAIYKMGTFTDANTFVEEYSFMGKLPESITYKRRR